MPIGIADDSLLPGAANFEPNIETATSYSFPAGFGRSEALKAVRDEPEPGMPPSKKVIIAWFNHDLEDLALALARFAPPGTHATVICANELKVRSPGSDRGFRFKGGVPCDMPDRQGPRLPSSLPLNARCQDLAGLGLGSTRLAPVNELKVGCARSEGAFQVRGSPCL